MMGSVLVSFKDNLLLRNYWTKSFNSWLMTDSIVPSFLAGNKRPSKTFSAYMVLTFNIKIKYFNTRRCQEDTPCHCKHVVSTSILKIIELIVKIALFF